MTYEFNYITIILGGAIAFFGCFSESVNGADYDPLAVQAEVKVAEQLLTVRDEERSREIPIKLYLPVPQEPAPVILFSHGLGGSREMSPFIGKHWAARGYLCVFLQHPGSDVDVWQDVGPLQRMAALRKAANAENFMLRVKDVPAVLDQLEKWNKEAGHALKGRVDLEHVGMSGHSFGAVTTQAVSGQSAARGLISFTDKRIKAALPMSCSTPKGTSAEEAFSTVKIPWMVMTGTKDTSPIGEQTVESRLAVYPALPAGQKYELVLNEAEHSVFTERALPGERNKRNPNHHKAILALSTAFWDAYLKDDSAAKDWLDGEGAKKVLEKEDKWQRK